MRLIFDSVFKGYFSDDLLLLPVATSDVDAGSFENCGFSAPPAPDPRKPGSAKSQPIHGNVSHLSPPYPKSKVIFELSGFQTFFLAIGLIPRTARVHIRSCGRGKWKVIREIAFENRVENQSQLLMSLLTFSFFLKVRFRGIPRKSGLEGFPGQT